MLIQMLMNRPQMLGPVVAHTPLWVGGLLLALLGLGLSQTRGRHVSLRRVMVMPLAMTGLSLGGVITAFGGSPLFAYVLLAWLGGAAVLLAGVMPMAPAAGTRYDALRRSFHVPASWVPLLLILGIFLTKYVVGVDLAMQPPLARDGQYTLIVGTLYGAFSGIFAGRAARLWRLAHRAVAQPAAPALNT